MTTRLRRWAELLAIFGGVPTLFALGPPLPQIPSLLAVAAFCAAALVSDPMFDRHELVDFEGLRGSTRHLLLALVAAGPTVALVALATTRATLFDLPRRGAVASISSLLAYSLVSALPQELVYRTFFFHRYRELFDDDRALVLASTVAFAFLHVIYRNAVAVLLTLVGGWFLSRTYARTRSLPAVGVEHALYGAAVFIAGLGHDFGASV